jgi:pimeloyl-ACP methyl ester carboxylesterase
MSRPISVRGGAGGVEAHYDDMTQVARLFGRATTDTGGTALALHGYLVHPALVASAALDPAGAAEFVVRLAAALDGPSGMAWLVARCAAIDVGLRGAAAAYLTGDRLDERGEPAFGAVAHAPAALYGGATQLVDGDAAGALQKMITADPEVADLGVDLAAELLGGGSVRAGTGLMGLPFDDGVPEVRDLGVDDVLDAAGAPRNLEDLLAGLAWRDKGSPGEVDVRILDVGSGGGSSAGRRPARQVIVDIPGTKTWSLTPHNGDVTSIATNLRALGGEVTSYERGVVEAMRRAGVRPDDDVVMVGHSEGGMVAINAARHLAATGEFQVRHVVTAGAPIGLISGRVPSGIDVLALENEGDVVPHLDGTGNPDRLNILTVTTHRDHGSIRANHDLDASYLPGARDVDASSDPSVRRYLGGLHGVLTAASVHTYRYRITRGY